ncbi:MAG TPA: carboxypeptidase-like regulatory domain-containing protein, partial [Candidatus Tumulicola sp.]
MQSTTVSLRRFARAAAVLILCAFASVSPSYAANANAYLSGTVTRDGNPVSNVAVRANGNNLSLKTTSDAHGNFRFPPLPLGTYEVTAEQGVLRGRVRVDLNNGDANIGLALSPAEIAHAVVSRANVTRGSGSDVALNSTDLTQLPFNNDFTEMEMQMPGAVRGANGVVHINGDHGVINYTIDGVQLPQELNRDLGSEININDLSFVDVIEGAYPAQYGLRFGSVFNMTTRAGIGPAGFDGDSQFGSYADGQTTIGYHHPIAGGGGIEV